MQTRPQTPPALKNLDTLSRLMDAQFRLPGTQFRFGLDAVIGLVPGGGDFISFLVSAYMLSILAKNGASGWLLSRMVLNIVIDALVGAIPVLGDLFDFVFKANQRNMRLMREHYVEGRHRGSARKMIIPLLLILLVFLVGLIWLTYRFFNWLVGGN